MQAIEMLEHGLSVFPLAYQSKKPAVSSWSKYQKEFIDENSLEDHAGNFGIVTGELSGLTVVDADNEEAVRWVEANLPRTPFSVNTRRGKHYYFKHDGETNSRPTDWHDKVDIRGEGGYVVAPSSMLPCGFIYVECVSEGFDGFDDLPLLNLPKEAQNTLKINSTVQVLEGNLKLGNRNTKLSTVAYRLAVNDFKYEEALAIMNALNAQQKNPLASIEVYKLVEGKYKLKVQGRLEKYVEVEDLSRILKLNASATSLAYPKAAGLVLELQEYILSNSFMLQPAFALGAGLGILSALAGNIYKFDGKAPNVYLFAIGKSGTGKNDPMRIIKSLLAGKLNRPDLVGAGKYASSVSIIEDLPGNRQRIDVIDEASAQFEMATKFGAGSFQSSIIETLNELYTSSLSRFAGERSRTHGITGGCWFPYVSIYATTTPEGFKSFFSRSLVAKGIGGRLSIFNGDDRPTLNTSIGSKQFNNKPDLAFLASLRPMLREDVPLPIELPTEANAGDYWRDYKRNKIEAVFSLNDGLERTIHAREVEQANKFVQLHAIGRNPRRPRIEMQDIIFGTELAKICLNSLFEILDENIAENQHEAMLKEINSTIKELGNPTKQDLKKKLMHIRARDLEECLTTLADTEEIRAVKSRNKIYYCHTSQLSI